MKAEKIRQAVILAGGKGMRLRPLTLTTPKPMVMIHEKPFLAHIIELLRKNGIKNVLILTGYLHEQIEQYFEDGRKFGLSISYSHSSVSDDTGTRIRKARELIEEEFILLYADNYWPLQLRQIYAHYKKMGTQGLVTIYTNEDHYSKNNILVNEKGLVEIYNKKGGKNLNGVDIGFFILNKKIIDLLPNRNCSFEGIVIPKLIKQRQLAGFLTHHKYYGLSNFERIPAIEDFITEKKVVFLDRDGVINQKPKKAHYITHWKDFKFLPRVKDALKLLKKKGYTIFIVTNQSGIARNMLREKQLDSIHANLLKEIKRIGVEIREIYVCVHGWDEGCFCRKPNPGMFFQAASKYNIDLYKSYCIGDDERDIMAGQHAGCKTFLVDSKNSLYLIVKRHL